MTGFALLDTDNLIVEEAQMSIPEIFRQHGEDYFRKIETAILGTLVGRIGLVVATGGGIISSEKNRRILPQIGPVVWLDAHPDQLHQRVKHSKRPLLQTDNPRKTLTELYRAREPLYQKSCSIRVDSGHLTHRQTAEAVLAALQSSAT